MGEQDVRSEPFEEELRAFMKALLADLSALERMLASGMVESGVRRIGAEQELFLIDDAGRPSSINEEVLRSAGDERLTYEIGKFNLEANLSPVDFGDSCLHRLEEEANECVAIAREAANAHGADVALTGILPSLEKSDLCLENMTPYPRYYALNDALSRLRGSDFHLLIKGVDDIDIKQDNVMLESVNASFQVHFQVGPEEFATLYNLAQAVTAPVLAAAANSPLLLGKRLWKETRIAVFQHSVDARSESQLRRGQRPRVHFGDRWVDDGVLEIFRDDIARFRVLLSGGIDEDPMSLLDRGEIPQLSALRLHNGTVYRWNRACYGVHGDHAHLRIENRVIPAGPTVVDEVANSAFYFGLLSGLAMKVEDIRERLDFDDVKSNFLAAARQGLRAQFTWLDHRNVSAQGLILSTLLPIAEEGLRASGIVETDIRRYLGIIEERVGAGMTGAQWTLDSFARSMGKATKDARLRALTRSMVEREKSGEPVHRWALADVKAAEDWKDSFRTVGRYMTTDLFTVRPGDLVDLAASLMDWEHVRHVPVEDEDGRLVGILSHRRVLRMIGKGLEEGKRGVAVSEIMKPDCVSILPSTRTLEAIQIMRQEKVGCLPVCEEGRLVGLITEADLVMIAARLLEEELREDVSEAEAGRVEEGGCE